MLFAKAAIRYTARLGLMGAHKHDIIPASDVALRVRTARSREH
jgi:hypothetical protein